MTTKLITQKILPILKRRGVEKAAIFGSFARGTADKNSDIDFLIKLPKNKTLLDLIGLRQELAGKLNRSVDVLSYGGIHHLLKRIILREQKVIYEKGKRS